MNFGFVKFGVEINLKDLHHWVDWRRGGIFLIIREELERLGRGLGCQQAVAICFFREKTEIP